MHGEGWHCRHVYNPSSRRRAAPRGSRHSLNYVFFPFFAKRLKRGEKKNYLFVLSNLIYVIYQIDRLFGKPDGPRLKSSVFPTCEKLCWSGHMKGSMEQVWWAPTMWALHLICPGPLISCPRPIMRVKGQKDPQAPTGVSSRAAMSQLFTFPGFHSAHLLVHPFPRDGWGGFLGPNKCFSWVWEQSRWQFLVSAFFSPLGFLVGKGKTGDGEQRGWLKGNR